MQWLRLGEELAGGSIVVLFDHYAITRLRWFVPRRRRVAVLGESPLGTRAVDRLVLEASYDLVLTHRRDLIERGSPYVRADFSTSFVTDVGEKAVGISKTRLVSFVGSIQHDGRGGYPFREEVARRLLEDQRIDCFGKGIRFVELKSEALLPYCFSVAMENCREDYYYTEKITDCFMCGTVPVYWGCPSIGEIFDPRGMITFESVPELQSILAELSFERYVSMRPYVLANRQRCFELGLDSFSSYVRRIVATIEAHVGIPERSIGRMATSKPMAGLRLLLSRACSRRQSTLITGGESIPG